MNFQAFKFTIRTTNSLNESFISKRMNRKYDKTILRWKKMTKMHFASLENIKWEIKYTHVLGNMR